MNSVALRAEIGQMDPDDLVIRHAPLAKRIAYHMLNRLPFGVQLDDLIQAGMIGLLEAARQYDASFGASFETYAGIRIRGSMLDEVRKNDWAPRSVYRKARQIAEVVRRIENRTGRDARDHEVAEDLNISLEEYHKMLQASCGHAVFRFDDIGERDHSVVGSLCDYLPEPLEGLQAEDFKRSLSEAISSLPERERMVLALYYDEEMNLREIGTVLGVTESRISQIHSQAIIRLQSRMSHWLQN